MGNNQSNPPKDGEKKLERHHSTKENPTSPNPRRDPPRVREQLQKAAAPPEATKVQAQGTVSSGTRASSKPPPSGMSKHDDTSTSPHTTSKAIEAINVPERKQDIIDEPTKPISVPERSSAGATSSHNEFASMKSPYSFTQLGGVAHDDAGYVRPPRLPLPIQEEVHTPGSPILAPTDIDAPILSVDELDGVPLPRQSSGLSHHTTEGEVSEVEDEELPIDSTKASMPYLFEWKGRPGQKVYVTGSIFQWSRKAKLHPSPGDEGRYEATLYVRPGTHHIRFIVDGDMITSPHIPTTVDFGNNLVNYIEVNADDVPKDHKPADMEAMGTPVLGDDKKKQLTADAAAESAAKEAKPRPKTKPANLDVHYTSTIPQYLIDLDKPEDSADYAKVAAAIEKLPQPPSLPGFLGKPLLNAATPMKDDNSVLNMPNHTVLNHLATSSIKNGVLAVSATTRYKFKYVTTLMYQHSKVSP